MGELSAAFSVASETSLLTKHLTIPVFSRVRKAFYVLPFQDYANVPMRFIQKTQYIIRIATIVFPPQKYMLHLFNLAKQP